MAWNEPGGNDRDPWGGNKKNDGPPDLDEALKPLLDKLNRMFGGSGSNNSNGSNGGFSFAAAGGVIVLALIIWFFSGWYQINEQERAVVLRLGVFNEVVEPGLHWNPPLLDKVEIENTTFLRTHRTAGRMLTQDLNLIEVNATVQYSISNIKDFALNVDDPENSLKEATDSALRHVIGTTSMDDAITTGRAAIGTEVKARLQSLMDEYGTGIQITKVAIENTDAPADVSDAFQDVSRAKEDQARMKQEAEAYSLGIVPIARGQAQRVEEEAQAYKQRVIAEAEGEAARFNSLLAEYKKAPEVTRERMYIDMMQQVLGSSSKLLIDSKSGNNIMYLPLDKMIGAAAAAKPDMSAAAQVESLRAKPNTETRKLRDGSR